MQNWTSYITDTDLKALRFHPIWERYLPLTPMGKRRKAATRPYSSHEKESWQKEIEDITLFLPLVADQERYELYVKGIEEIEPFLVNWQLGHIPHRIDWFHLHQFLKRGLRVIEMPAWLFTWERFLNNDKENWLEVLALLSPAQVQSNRENTFQIEELYPERFKHLKERLRELEQEKAELESKRKKQVEIDLGFEIGRGRVIYVSRREPEKLDRIKNHPAFRCIKETPFDLGFEWSTHDVDINLAHQRAQIDRAWEEAEIEANLHLAARLHPYIDKMIYWSKAFGKIDDLYAKACLAITYQGTVPVWDEKANEIDLVGGIHPWLAKLWNEKGDSFTPIDVSLNTEEVTVIVGPNMGGKSVALKTIGLCTLMAQLGLLVPAQYFRFTPVEGIMLIGGEQENMEMGLSSFGGEVKQLVDLWKCDALQGYLILCDEIGRGTNPEEGEALATAIVEELGMKNWFTCFVSHYSSVVHLPNLRIYQIQGIPEDWDSLEQFEESMSRYLDRRLHLVEKGRVPQTALTIATWLGMPNEIIQRAKNRLIHKGKVNTSE